MSINIRKEIDEILKHHKIFSEDIQNKIVNKDKAVTYATYLLTKNNVEATMQRICYVVFKLFPESFSFPEFPDFFDSRTIRNCLWHCRDKSKAWIEGTDKSHYILTSKGKDVISEVIEIVNNDMKIENISKYQDKNYRTHIHDKEMNFLKNTILESKSFKLFFKKDKDKIRSVDVKKSLGGDRYSSESFLKNKHFEATKLNTSYLRNKVLEEYLLWVKENWEVLVN